VIHQYHSHVTVRRSCSAATATVTAAQNSKWSKPAAIVKFAKTVAANVRPTALESSVAMMAVTPHVAHALKGKAALMDSAVTPAKMNALMAQRSVPKTKTLFCLVVILTRIAAPIRRLNSVTKAQSV